MNYNTDRLISEFNQLGIIPDDDCIKRFITYYELLIDWNSRINLTSITDFDEVVLRHFTDSLSVLKFVDIPVGSSLIDIGTGAGFPGIPIKIIRPDLDMMLVDSLNKRINFLNTVKDQLSLEKLSLCHGRAEDLGHDKSFREKYDFCFSRAVADMSVLSELALPFVKVGGYFVAYKSATVDEEVGFASTAISLLSGEIRSVFRFSLPDSDISRSLVLIEKKASCDEAYPRSFAKIKKKHL